MFKVIKKNKIIGISEKEPVLLDRYEVVKDAEHTIDDFVQVNGEYVLTSSEEAVEQMKSEIRAVRNQYLADTDKFMISDFPITEEERARYRAYRQYLRDYTKTDGWFNKEPAAFDDF